MEYELIFLPRIQHRQGRYRSRFCIGLGAMPTQDRFLVCYWFRFVRVRRVSCNFTRFGLSIVNKASW